MRQCHYVHKGMGMSTHYWVIHSHVYRMFFLESFLLTNIHSSIGIVWKSFSLMSEDPGVESLELFEVSMHTGEVFGLWSLLKDRQWQCTGLAGVYVSSLADVIGLQGVLCAGSKDVCSMLDTWCMCGILQKGVCKSSLKPLSKPSSDSNSCCVKAAFKARTKCPNKVSSDNWHRVWLVEVQKKWW